MTVSDAVEARPAERNLWSDCILPALVGFVPIVALSSAQGGYFPTAWGWSTLGLVLAAGVTILSRDRVELARTEMLFVGAWTLVACWITLSLAWTIDFPATVLDVERALVYFAAAAAIIVIAAGRDVRWLVGGALCAVGGVSLFSLATRIFPDTIRVYDPTANNRLAQPLGYWNGLSAYVVMGMLLALGFAARGSRLWIRGIAAALVVPLAATFYFTFGRTGWLALAVALVAAVAFDRRRVQLLAVMTCLVPIAGIGVWLASRYPGLTRVHATLASAAHDGRRLALWLALLAVAAAAAAVGLAVFERRVRVLRAVKLTFVACIVIAIVALGGVGTGHEGGPVTAVHKAWRAFKSPPVRPTNLNNRLLSLSGNGRYDLWRVAWDDAKAHPVLGSGAGTYERYFLRYQPLAVSRVRDAHGLYVETLAELGPFGLALLLVALLGPLAIALRRRGQSMLVGPIAGAYVAYLVHAASDWDWELPAVTLVALTCGSALVISGERVRRRVAVGPWLRGVAIGAAVVVAGFAGFALVGNSALATAQAANQSGNWDKAAVQARRAHRWMPWSPKPLLALGTAQLGAGLRGDARATFVQALSIDSGDWAVWADIASASSGAERDHALQKVVELFPRSHIAQKYLSANK
jgi:O-Antigen ligase